MFYVDWEFGGRKKLQGRDFFKLKTCYGRVTGNKQLSFRPDDTSNKLVMLVSWVIVGIMIGNFSKKQSHMGLIIVQKKNKYDYLVPKTKKYFARKPHKVMQLLCNVLLDCCAMV